MSERVTPPPAGPGAYRRLELVLFVLGVFFTAWFFVSLKVHFDNLQILDKAFRLIDLGEWTHYGNAGSHVGYTPGTLLTALTALPMNFIFSPYSAMAVIAIFHVTALGILLSVGRSLGSPRIGVIIFLLFWLNPWRVEQAELYNPAYLFLFATLHLWTALKLWTGSLNHSPSTTSSKAFWYSLAHVATIGFCAQIHFSALILGILSLLLWFKKMVRPHLGGVTAGILLVALSLVPYAVTLAGSPQIGVALPESANAYFGRNALLVYPVLKAILYWFRYGSMYFGRHIFSEIEFSWIQIDWLRATASSVFHILKWPIALTSLMASFYVMWPLLKQLKRTFLKVPSFIQVPWLDPERSQDAQPLLLYVQWLFVAMVISAGLSPVEFNHWHLILCFPAVSLVMSLAADHALKSLPPRQARRALFAVAVAFSVYNAFAAMGSRSHSWKYNFHQDVMKHYGR